MKYNVYETKDILEFARENNLYLVVNERDAEMEAHTRCRYYVSFDRAEIKEGSILISTSGNGNTVYMAVTDYCNRISKTILIIGAYTDNRREIRVPILTCKPGDYK